jgi:hypothetical protein
MSAEIRHDPPDGHRRDRKEERDKRSADEHPVAAHRGGISGGNIKRTIGGERDDEATERWRSIAIGISDLNGGQSS